MRAIRPGIPHQIFMTDAVFKAAREECAKWLKLGLECGGSLLGVFGEWGLLLLYAVLTGPAAKQAHGGVTTDAGYQNRAIDALHRNYPGLSLEYAGDFHLHPFDMAGLSGTDIATILSILADPLHKDLPFLCAQLWYVVQAEVLGVKVYTGSRDQHSSRIVEVPFEVIPADHPLVRRVLQGRTYQPLVQILASMHVPQPAQPEGKPDGWHEPLRLVLRDSDERINREEQDLETLGWKTMGHTVHSDGKVVHGTLGRFECSLIFPPEYPLNGPVSLFKDAKEEDFREYAYPFPWNSWSSPYDILEKFLEEHPHEPEPANAGSADRRQPAARDDSGNHPEETRRTIAVV